MFFNKLLGLLTVLSIPTILKILQHTNMSSSPKTAYKRYLATLFHMCIWYEDEFSPGSGLWRSVREVKSLHNSASKRGCMAGLSRINQKEMAFTQFGFMGYALVRSEMVGIHNANEQNWHDFVHVWRVIGHIMGIEDRFNICRESVEETRAICNILIEKVFRPSVAQKDNDFIAMGTYLIQGMWTMNPTLEINVYLVYLNNLLQSPVSNNNVTKNQKDDYVSLNKFQKFHLFVINFVIYLLKFSIIRLYHNYLQYSALWLMKVFPFLAYYKFGYSQSKVKVLSMKSNFS